MPVREYFDEWTFWLEVGIGLTVFVAGFKPLMKVIAAKVPVDGLRELLAA
jgi:hypothetical protein